MIVVLLLSACASGPRLRYKHEYSLSPGQEHHAGLAKVLLLPIDAANEDPIKGLDVANDRITAMIVSLLESRGIAVTKADPARLGTAYRAALAKVLADRKSGTTGVVSAKVELDDTIPTVLEELGAEADLVISPTLAIREAESRGTKTLVWDGVRRIDHSVGNMDLEGSWPAASILMTIYKADGQEVFRGYGGLDLFFEFDGRNKVTNVREDLFSDDENLAEGVCIAFYPYFGMDQSCRM